MSDTITCPLCECDEQPRADICVACADDLVKKESELAAAQAECAKLREELAQWEAKYRSYDGCENKLSELVTENAKLREERDTLTVAVGKLLKCVAKGRSDNSLDALELNTALDELQPLVERPANNASEVVG